MLIDNGHAAQHGPDNAEIALIRASNEQIVPRRSAALDFHWAAVNRSGPLAGEAFNCGRREAVLKNRIAVIVAKNAADSG